MAPVLLMISSALLSAAGHVGRTICHRYCARAGRPRAPGNEPNDFGQWRRPGDSPQNSLYSALEEWVEKDVRPNSVIATKFAIDGNPTSAVVKTRRICPYPGTARRNHLGSDSDATNYVCP
ncbi:MAG: tannase/feruloyl esterase family alpha/beta hydrolase [Gemmatimonadota bacterium]|nr:tannase/feruloyl esterase family alpha/beta hydrolase [Gemmatimonadota bacterium]